MDNGEAAIMGCTCLVFGVIFVALYFLFYFAAFHVAEYFGVNGWVGVGIAFIASTLLGSLRAAARKG